MTLVHQVLVEPRRDALIPPRRSPIRLVDPAIRTAPSLVSVLSISIASPAGLLIVIGSHGGAGFAGILFGSVSAAAVRSARIPVIVAPQS